MQVISVLAFLVEARSISGPFLIVCPSSVLPNWEAELHTWAPSMRTLLYQGSVAERKALLAKHVRPPCLLRSLSNCLCPSADPSPKLEASKALVSIRLTWSSGVPEEGTDLTYLHGS